MAMIQDREILMMSQKEELAGVLSFGRCEGTRSSVQVEGWIKSKQAPLWSQGRRQKAADAPCGANVVERTRGNFLKAASLFSVN